MTKVVKTHSDIPWLPSGSQMELIQGSKLPIAELITSVHLLCFSGTSLLMIKHRDRGWDIPGGHVESGEPPEAALKRELYEESGATARAATPFAHLKIKISAPKPDGYKYPYPESYIACFVATLDELLAFEGKFETIERRLFTPKEVRQLDWHKKNSDLYELGLTTISNRSA